MHRGDAESAEKKKFFPLRFLHLCGVILLLASCAKAAWPIAVPNAGFEKIGPHGVPAGWEHVTYWSNSGFDLEKDQAHSGGYAVRINGAPHAQGYMRMVSAIDVSPGEDLEAGAWVRLKDVPANQCATIVAEFINTDGQSNDKDFVRFVNIPGNSDAGQKWVYVHGTIKAPPMAAKMRLRLGFWNGQGTAWFDDVRLVSHTAVGCRIDLPWGELLPKMDAAPIRVINRTDAAMNLNVAITFPIAAELRSARSATRSVAATVKLGESTLHIPIDINQRGTFGMKVNLLDEHGQTVATDSRQITIPPAVRLSSPIPTHWAIEDGMPHITGDIYLALPRAPTGLVVRLLDKSGKVRALWIPNGGDVSPAPLPNGNFSYILNPGPLPVGNYTISVDLWTDKEIKIEQPFTVLPRKLESSHLNHDGYLVYDDKPIFPLGIFNGDAKLKEMSESGFTITHAYNACDVIEGRDPSDADLAAMNFLNDTDRAGMKAIFLIPRDYVFHHDWAAFRRRIDMFRNHPALAAWDEEEGIARGDMAPADLAKMRRILHEEDPNHPLMVGDSRVEIEKITDRSNFFPVQQMDLGMWWWYPIPPMGHAGALNGDEDTAGLELSLPSFLVKRNTDKPIWVGVQAYDKKGEDPTFKAGRYPTPAEYRAQAYIAIIAGAKGLMWYGGSVAGGIYEDPKAGHWDDLKKLVTELHAMIPVFLSPTVSPPDFKPKDAPISVMRKHAAKGDVIFAVNRGANSFDITFQIAPNRTISDHFDPYAVHIYHLPK